MARPWAEPLKPRARPNGELQSTLAITNGQNLGLFVRYSKGFVIASDS